MNFLEHVPNGNSAKKQWGRGGYPTLFTGRDFFSLGEFVLGDFVLSRVFCTRKFCPKGNFFLVDLVLNSNFAMGRVVLICKIYGNLFHL